MGRCLSHKINYDINLTERGLLHRQRPAEVLQAGSHRGQANARLDRRHHGSRERCETNGLANTVFPFRFFCFPLLRLGIYVDNGLLRLCISM